MKLMKIAAIQMNVCEEKEANLRKAEQAVRIAKASGADLAALPEMFLCPYATELFPSYAEPEGGSSYLRLSELARDNVLYLVAGSMPEIDSQGRIYNTSYVFDPSGQLIGKHRKAHLFDISIQGGQHFKESDTLTAGDHPTVFDTSFAKIGLAICYDFRFPELSRSMVDRGAEIIIVPAAFNMTTGPAHWEVLFRSRAIDNQVYTLGVAPARNEKASYVSYGNSIFVSPWGDVVDRLGADEGIMMCDVDLEKIMSVRRQLPLLAHRRPGIY